jgi:hypothetical protein
MDQQKVQVENIYGEDTFAGLRKLIFVMTPLSGSALMYTKALDYGSASMPYVTETCGWSERPGGSFE